MTAENLPDLSVLIAEREHARPSSRRHSCEVTADRLQHDADVYGDYLTAAEARSISRAIAALDQVATRTRIAGRLGEEDE